jgi:glycosyltransferase involved in cell wall biosynthesis
MPKYVIFVFARLKASQIKYKIIPLSKSNYVEQVYVLTKTKLHIDNEKITCISLPSIFQLRFIYWIFTSVYGAWLIDKKKANLILSYNIFPHGFNGFLASILTNSPFIYAEINEDTIRYHKQTFTRSIILNILKKAQNILVPGSKIKNYWNSLGFSNIIKLHSTIDTDFYVPGNKLKLYDFIYIGEFDFNKRPDIILASFIDLIKRGIKASLCLIGYGILEDRLIDTINKGGYNNNVTLIKTNNVLPYLQQSKIFIMASISEGIPCSLLESMSCQLIPIVPRVGDIPDVVKIGKNGILYDGTYTELNKWMERILLNYDNLLEMRINARTTIITEHSYKIATDTWNRLLSNFHLRNHYE